MTFFVGIPVWVGRKLHNRYKGSAKHKRNCAVMGGVAASVSLKNIKRLFYTYWSMRRSKKAFLFGKS